MVIPGVSTTYALTATGPGGSASRTVTVTVTAPPTVLEVACSGASCGASNPYLYSGTGVGIRRYRNASGATQTVDLHVGGVSAGMQALLLFSNGTANGMTVLPSAGALLSPRATTLRMEEPFDSGPAGEFDEAWHRSLLEANRELGLALRSARIPGTLAHRAPVALLAPVVPVVGDHRVWNENASNPIVTYDTVAREIVPCPAVAGP